MKNISYSGNLKGKRPLEELIINGKILKWIYWEEVYIL